MLTLSNIYLGDKKYQQAQEIYDKMLAVNPDQPNIRYNRALCLKNIGKMQEAVRDYDEVIRNQPNNLYSLMGRASCLMSLKEYNKAAEDYKKSSELEP